MDSKLIEQLYSHDFSFPNKEVGHKWLDRYIKFIDQCIAKNTLYGTEGKSIHKHHIVPRSWGGCNRKFNIVVLTTKQHVVAHHIISKTYDPQMINAITLMLKKARIHEVENFVVTIREYESILEEHYRIQSIRQSGVPKSEAQKKQISETLTGKYVGENSWNHKAVIRLDTLEVFETAKIASLKYSDNKTAVSAAIKSNYKFNGARWQLYQDYLNGVELPRQRTSSRFKGKRHDDTSKAKTSASLKGRKALNEVKIINLDTGQIFDNMCLASESVGYNKTTMSSCFYRASKKGEAVIKMAGMTWIKYSS